MPSPYAHTVGELREMLKEFPDDTPLIGYDGSDELVRSGISVHENDEEDDPDYGSVTIGIES
jgi:hypothetical protein